MEGYFRVIESIDRCGSGPLLVAKRECGDYHQLAFLGVYFAQSNLTGISVLYQAASKVDDEGRIEQISHTWLTQAFGAVQLPPLIINFPNHPIPRTAWDQKKKEAIERLNVTLTEAYAAKCRKPNCNKNDIEGQLVDLIRSMNLGG